MPSEKIRSNSLLPGTSVLPLLKTSPLITDDKLVAIFSQDNICIGFISSATCKALKGFKSISFPKFERVKFLKLKNPSISNALKEFAQELEAKRIILKAEHQEDSIAIFPVSNTTAPLTEIPPTISEFVGAKTSRVILIAHHGRDRNMSIMLGRRLPTTIVNPSKLQCLLSFYHNALSISREELAEVAHKFLDLQPAFFTKLKCAGIVSTMLQTVNGYQRASVNVYELDLTDFGNFKPQEPTGIESYEMIPIKTVLDSCHAGAICSHDIPAIISFCIRHGIITPETEEDYNRLYQVLAFDASNPLIFEKNPFWKF